jgi:tetratricopeptide (TPR) repeat protein
MLMEHPTTEDFEGFLQGTSRPGHAPRKARVLRHLLADCSTCRQQLRVMGWGEERLERLLSFPAERGEGSTTAASSFDYGRAFAGAEQALDAFFAEGRQEETTPEELLAELAPLPLQEQARWVAADSRFASPQLVRKLIEMSHAVRYENPARMLHLSDLARLAADTCTATAVGSAPKLADLRAQGWRQYANALRVAGRLREAEDSFARTQTLCSEGTGDPPLRASLLTQMASLRVSQRRFDQAIELADEATRIYRDLGDTQAAAGTMVQMAIAQLFSGTPEAAIRTLNRAVPMIDHEGDPHLLLAASHNLIRCYIELEQPEQALSIYFEMRDLYREFQDPLIAVRAGWQEGQILRDLGHLRAAEAALLGARQGFLDRALFYETAVVSLDLSAVYLRLGETEKLREAVLGMVPIFTSLGVDREALAALLQLQQATQQSRQGFELIRFLSSRLEQLPHRQGLNK